MSYLRFNTPMKPETKKTFGVFLFIGMVIFGYVIYTVNADSSQTDATASSEVMQDFDNNTGQHTFRPKE